jgi:hypothetical protein
LLSTMAAKSSDDCGRSCLAEERLAGAVKVAANSDVALNTGTPSR